MKQATAMIERMLRIPESDWSDLGEVAAATDTNRNAIIRKLVRVYLQKVGTIKRAKARAKRGKGAA